MKVKKLDEMYLDGESGSDLPVLDHVGIALWRAAHRWRERMATEMAARGYPWHQTAAGEVLAHLGPEGVSQRALTERMGMSKQAVQQLVDQLEALDVVRRVPDPEDKRARRIALTTLGERDFAERNRVKIEIEEEYREHLGEEAFEALLAALAELNA